MRNSGVKNMALALGGLAFSVSAFPTTAAAGAGLASTNNTTASSCPPFNSSSFVINQFQLYPENAKFDFQRCVVFFGALFNASVAVYNPYTNQVTESITFPGLTGDPSLHLGPALPDGAGGLTVLFDAAAPFSTNGADVSGGNILIKYDLDAKTVRWQRNLTELVTKGRYGGFQDLEHDRNLNVYVVGTFPGTVLRSDKDGNGLTEWFVPPAAQLANTTVAGFSGLAAIPASDILLSNNNADGEIYRFDAISSSATGTPIKIPRTVAGQPGQTAPRMGFTDGIVLPKKYNNTVLLLAEDAAGVIVVRSRDGLWQSAEALGTVSNNVTEAQGGMVVTPVQIGAEKIFAVQEFFLDTNIVPGTLAGNRSAFPMVDITAQVDALLAKFP